MATTSRKVVAKPTLAKDKVSNEEMERFIAGAPDGGNVASLPPEVEKPKNSRKKLISLTMDEKLLKTLDSKAAALGISRAAAISLAVSRFNAAEDREASR